MVRLLQGAQNKGTNKALHSQVNLQAHNMLAQDNSLAVSSGEVKRFQIMAQLV